MSCSNIKSYPGLEWENPGVTFVICFVLIVFGVPLVSIIVWVLSSEQMGKCAPERIVPWANAVGSKGRRLRSYTAKKDETKIVVPSKQEDV